MRRALLIVAVQVALVGVLVGALTALALQMVATGARIP